MCKKYFSEQNFWKNQKVDQKIFLFALFYFQTKHSEKHKITGKSPLFQLEIELPQDCLNTLVQLPLQTGDNIPTLITLCMYNSDGKT